jgi:hypothetical protein
LILRAAIETLGNDLDAALRSVPALYWHQGGIAMFEERGSRLCGLRRLRVTMVDDPPDVLMFDPSLARRLGWRLCQEEPYAYQDEDGELMVSTVFWRDGWLQECQFADEMRWGEGQRVCFTERGLAEYCRHGSLPPAVTQRWRSYVSGKKRPTETSSWISEQLLSTG